MVYNRTYLRHGQIIERIAAKKHIVLARDTKHDGRFKLFLGIVGTHLMFNVFRAAAERFFNERVSCLKASKSEC